MSTEFLELYKENCEDILEESLPLVGVEGLNYASLLTICSNYHTKAIVHLLLEYDPCQFNINLFKSGRTFLAGLIFIPESEIAISKAQPLFDAIVSDDIHGATAISKLLPKVWNKHKEYKEDFLYVIFIMSQFGLIDDKFDFDDFCEESNILLNGAVDLRLNVLKAIYTHDQAFFDEAFIEYLDDYKSTMLAFVEKESLSPEQAATDCYIFISGILILKLAEKEKIAIDKEYPMIPFVSHKKMGLNYDKFHWDNPFE